MEKNSQQESSFAKALFITVALIVLCAMISALGLFWIFPALGIAIAISAGAWGALISTVFLLCIALLLCLFVPFFIVLLLGLLALIWVVCAIVFFPIVFPIVTPILLLLLFIGYLRRRKQIK